MPLQPGPQDNEFARAAALRTQAERRLGADRAAPPLPNAGRLAVDYQLQQHELQVHQIELSLQMEELQRSNVELQRMRDVYRDLYDLTPVGYFTLSQDGRVLEVNRAGCQLLGLEREALLRQRFSAYLDEASSVPFVLLLRQAFTNADAGANANTGAASSDPPQQIQPSQAELTLALPGRGRAFIQLDVLAEPGSNPPFLRAAVTDISALKAAQRAVTELNAGMEQQV
ncbi:PAS domain-containing protein [Deinococcus arenicola]|uniref:PAS domain-containing protein n=1 Tax=Deinococcus arenicola TaxID=2994950 RepID=A0ABU4DRM9_9DEIO|nr:PAS domain-containing protein [Deinococcus sp. ZS9-10]MDV6375096.1 PAS domain-containing protein [Deinococcus sp. ZS9-10]